METLEKTQKITENSYNNIIDVTIETIDEICKFAHFNEFIFNKHPKEILSEHGINDDLDIKIGIKNLSKNQLKKIKNIINGYYKKPSLRLVNLFLHFIYSKILKSSIRISLNYPEKQLKIIEMRKKYVEARNAAIKAYQEYKTEKGDYYKIRLSKKQKIQ